MAVKVLLTWLSVISEVVLLIFMMDKSLLHGMHCSSHPFIRTLPSGIKCHVRLYGK